MDHAQMLFTQFLKDFILHILDIIFDVWLEIITNMTPKVHSKKDYGAI